MCPKKTGLNENTRTIIDYLNISNQATHPCPDYNKPMLRRKGKKGYWWGYTGYPDCTTTAFDEKGKPKLPPGQKPGKKGS